MPKFVNNENTQIIKAVKEFTDREEPRKVFWNEYNSMKDNIQNNKISPINVIAYYGYGGIGKSRLLIKLRDEIMEKEPNVKYEFLDFEKITDLNNNLLEILKYIRHTLNKKYNFAFPFFDLVAYEYETKLGKDVTKKELESIFEENTALNILTDVLEEIPIISPIAKIVSIIDRSKTALKSKLQENRLKDKLLEFNKMSVEEMKTQLPYYFSIDLKENIKDDNIPFVFFIDTYEKLVNELSSSGNVLDNDLWLRGDNGLISNIPNTLWVLAGREKLKWEEVDSDWVGSIDQHLLKNLSFQDTKTFLLKAGIENEDLIHQIYDLTNGYPMFLDMCVDIYVSLKNNGKSFSIEDFGKDTTDLTKRFFLYMNNSERDFSTLLAFIPYWTDEDIEERVLKLNGNFSYSLYEKVKTFSFIVNEDGHYKVQNSIRDIIIMNTPNSLKSKYNKLIEEETLNQVKKIELNEEAKIEEELNNELKTETNINLDNKEVKESINVTESRQKLKAISNFNNYTSKYEFEKIIDNQKNKLINSKEENDFKANANLLIKLILQYEEKFNRPYILDDEYYCTLAKSDFGEMLEVKKLVSFREYDFFRKTVKFNDLEEKYGDSKDILFNEIHECRWQMNEDRTKFENSKVKELIIKYYGKDSLYGYCTIDDDYEFVEKILNYTGNINNFYIKLLFMTLNPLVLGSYIESKYPNVKLSWRVNNPTGYEFYHMHIPEIFKVALKKYFYVLKENESLINYSVLNDIFSLSNRICNYEAIFGDSYTYYDMDDATDIFDFIYSISYIALKTTDYEIIQKFKELFYTFLGGINNDKRIVFKENKQYLAKRFLKDLSNHFIELYGESSYDAYEIDNFLNKEFMTPERLDKTLNVLIDNFGPKSNEVSNILIQFLNGINKYQGDPDELSIVEIEKYKLILDNFNDYINVLLKYFKEYEFNYDYDRFRYGIRALFYQILKPEHIKYLSINTLDDIITLAESKNECFYKDDDVLYLKRAFKHITEEQLILNSNLENKYEQKFLSFCRNNRVLEEDYDYKLQICDLYVIYKFYIFLNNDFHNKYESQSFGSYKKYLRLKEIDNSNFEDVGNLVKYLTIELVKPIYYTQYGFACSHNEYGFFSHIDEYYRKHRNLYMKDDIKPIFDEIDCLYNLYKYKYGTDSNKTILLRAYKYTFESFMYMKSGSEMLDMEIQKYRNKDNKDEDTLKELEKLKLAKDYYIFLVKHYYKECCDKEDRHDFELQDWTLDQIMMDDQDD